MTIAYRPSFPQYAALILIAGAVFWAVALVMQAATGVVATDSLVISVVAFLDVALGIWALHLVRSEASGLVGLVGTSLLSVSFLLFAGNAVAAGLAAEGRNPADPSGTTFFGFSALAGLVGALLFAVAVHRVGLFPRWTGAAVIVGMLGTLLVAAAEVAPFVRILASLLLVASFITMAFVVLAQFRSRPTPAA